MRMYKQIRKLQFKLHLKKITAKIVTKIKFIKNSF